MRLGILVALVGVGACQVSPVPEPPNLDPRRITAEPVGCEAFCLPTTIVFEGAAGSAEPGSTISITSLDTEGPTTRATVAADGSFGAEVEGFPTDEFRLRLMSDDSAAPIDVVLGAGDDPVALAPRPLADCLTVSPAWDVPLGVVAIGETRSAAVRIDNACEQSVTVSDVSTREPVEGVTLGGPTTPFPIASGASDTVTIEWVPSVIGALEEVVRIEVSVPERDRRATVVTGTAE